MKIETGMRVQHTKRTTEGDNRSKIKKRSGTVIGVYPHIFNVVFDGATYEDIAKKIALANSIYSRYLARF